MWVVLAGDMEEARFLFFLGIPSNHSLGLRWPGNINAVCVDLLTSVLFLLPSSSRMIEIQSQMTERAVELLGLPEDRPCFLLDVG